MITNDDQLKQAIEQLALMSRILDGLCNEVLSSNRPMFDVMAEGPLDQLQRLIDQINEYVVPRQEKADALETHAA